VPLLLARIDDRLVHGQVAFGWGKALQPTLFAIVSDALAADPAQAELYLLGVPEGARGRTLSVSEALGPAFREEVGRERTVLLLPGTDEALRLIEGGFPIGRLNLGGLHHAPGKRERLPYVFLDEEDRCRLSAMAARGVIVAAQDLPGNPSHPLEALLGGAS
jgi:mannose/fructose/N-acetylgalactosamine-specific phosphotransferase system component IIB